MSAPSSMSAAASRQAFHRVGGVHLIGLAVAVMRGGLRRVAERAVERGGVLHRIGHDRRIHIPRLVQRFADSQNAAVHHVGRRHHVRTGLDMAEGGLGKQFQRGIVHHFAAGVAFLQNAAMTVRSVFAQTHVGHNLQIRPLRLKHTDGRAARCRSGHRLRWRWRPCAWGCRTA